MNNRELIINFYDEFFTKHNIEAANKYVAENYIQHNPGLEQGRESLKNGFKEKFLIEPDFHLKIIQLISEDDMVMVYLKNIDKNGHTKCRVVDIYRVENNKLAEHWDVLQPC